MCPTDQSLVRARNEPFSVDLFSTAIILLRNEM